MFVLTTMSVSTFPLTLIQAGSAAETAKWIDTPVLVALVSGLMSLVISCLTAFFAYRTKVKEAELSDFNAEKKARRDYEYDARKRLYQQCEPLLFELNELSFGGMKRIGSLARNARKGNLDRDAKGWLSTDGYYTQATVYKLLAPLVVVKIMQRRLTLVDLSLDERIQAQYQLAQYLYLTFTKDSDFAEAEPKLEYDADLEFQLTEEEFRARLAGQPEKYSRQGLSVGRLDNAVEALLVQDGKDSLRCVSFGEFEAQYQDKSSDLHRKFSEVVPLFVGFHPRTKPVLWRMLITQLHLYRTIIRNSETRVSLKPGDGCRIDILSEDERRRFDWRRKEQAIEDRLVLEEPFEVARRHLNQRFGNIVPADQLPLKPASPARESK